MPQLARILDATLEWAVVPSFTRVGYAVRRRVAGWRDLDAFELEDITLEGYVADPTIKAPIAV